VLGRGNGFMPCIVLYISCLAYSFHVHAFSKVVYVKVSA